MSSRALLRSIRALALCIPMLAPAVVCAQAARAQAPDADPPLDTLHPPSQVAVAIPSHGVPLNGVLYLPQGTGRHRTVVLVHGFPGVEKNLDLAQALRRDGYAVLYFDFRGVWGTGGEFSFGNALEDLSAALAWLRSPVSTQYNLDTSRLVLVGHSFGGWLTLMTLASDPAIACAAAFAPGNRPGEAARWGANPAQRETFLRNTRAYIDPQSGPVRGRAEEIVAEIEAHHGDWDLVGQVPRFGRRPLLLVTGRRDVPHMAVRDDLLKALSAAGARVRDVVLDDNHTFDASRIASARLLVSWLKEDCRP